jgi:hypothetical protein
VAFYDADGSWVNFGVRLDVGTPSMGATIKEPVPGGALMTWHGAIVWRGEATLPIGEDWDKAKGVQYGIPHGSYRLVAHRGTEYDLTEARVVLAPNMGEVTVELPLARTVDTTGYRAADMHLHAAPGSGDARITIRDRLKTVAAAGLDVGVSADHDFNTDFVKAAQELWPADAPIAVVNGNEASGIGGHFGVYPAVPDASKPFNGAPDPRLPSNPPRAFFDRLHALPGAPLVQLNHARLGWEGAAYLNGGSPCGVWRDRSKLPACPLDFEVMEVLSGYLSCGSKIEETLQDWLALIRLGVVTTATGNSDSHGTVNHLAGFPRTYVRVADDRPGAFSQDEFIGALRARRAIATTGPFLTIRVNGEAGEGDLAPATERQVRVSARMQAASWVQVDEVQLRVNGVVVKSWPVPRVGDATPLLEVRDELVDVGEVDAFVTVEARGSRPLPPFVVGEYTVASPVECPPLPGSPAGMLPFAITNPVFVDRDGNGQFAPPR